MHAYECLGSPRKSYELAGGLGNSLEVLASQPIATRSCMSKAQGWTQPPGLGSTMELLCGCAARPLHSSVAPSLECLESWNVSIAASALLP